MKAIQFLFAMLACTCMIAACGNNKSGTTTNADSIASGRNDSLGTVIPPPDNSAATNPSLADTNYSKNHDSSSIKKDSINRH